MNLKMKLKRISITQTVRHVIQLVAFILFPGLFISTFSALGDIVKALVNGTFSVSALSVQLITVSGIFVITALWGRFFCGFLCSFGALQDLLAVPFKKFRLKHRIPKKLDSTLKYLKFVILAFFVLGVWAFALPFNSSLSPWGIFGMLTSGNISLVSAAIPTAGFILLMAIMVASMFIERFFCRYLCPLGAIFKLISGKRFFKIRCNNMCVNCGLCTKKCAMGIDIAGQKEVTSAECIDCMKCITACPRGSLCSSTAPAVAGTAAALVMCGVVTVGKITVPDSSASAAYISEETGSGNDNNEPEKTIDTMETMKLESGTVNINATASQPDDVQSGADYDEPEKIEETIESNLDSNAELRKTEESIESDIAPDAKSNGNSEFAFVADGVYQGSGTGFRGTTEVSVTVKDGMITDITVESYADDDQFFGKAQSGIIDSILSEQTINVDTVSGATFSGNGIIEAVANAMGISPENLN
ncbi:MAG: 4Fe-4S binding protein [Saccharofermentanales bacterium]